MSRVRPIPSPVIPRVDLEKRGYAKWLQACLTALSLSVNTEFCPSWKESGVHNIIRYRA
jgi:hypothetical protein